MIVVEWDEDKRLANIAKHALDFCDVPAMDWDVAVVVPDLRFDYPEPRFWAFAPLDGRLHMAAFCYRGTKVRLISFRKANRKGDQALWQKDVKSAHSPTTFPR